MKSKLLLLSATLSSSAPFLARAQKLVNPLGPKGGSIEQIVLSVVNIVQILLIMATVLYLLYAGLMFVTARGGSVKTYKSQRCLVMGNGWSSAYSCSTSAGDDITKFS